VDKNRMIAVVSAGAVVVLLAATAVTASLGTSTPLYTVRMEQASSRMNYLPTVVNTFSYTVEPGYTLLYDSLACCSVKPLDKPTMPVCEPTEETCWTECGTCLSTCPDTCEGLTCDTCDLCPTNYTCHTICTCGSTCDTC
jgi:hypothetical protein